ncbi:monosaccharide ABC transporter ATP-binding protein, CUT2 family [Onishia taeanensis]|uniref:Monosaccharide ABC transporter ATP-binding protein, CUT2 family n=1 Tax=Onishia taeanensis TaxID=284577 RepID=A0A1G7Q6Z5_9GAMM|nr:sugar ABC transporter ATP-binding protein [Halomonas taeanensis]SDF94243.1 monosaccharide ABC transporter ATP-binding protein, CUT2 family [Halomonas taeanensis]
MSAATVTQASDAPGKAEAPILSLVNITKKFPGVIALNMVSFDVRAGEVHALLGENGAGKSTLMKVLAGKHKPNGGQILLEGKEKVFDNPKRAKKSGIVLIHQEQSLVPEMSVAENIFLGSLPKKWGNLVDWKRLHRESTEILDRLKCSFSSKDMVSDLSIAKKQMVEIARALVFTPKVVVFDEPTASLTDHEKPVLYDIINTLREQGVGIVYISHRMDEIFHLSQRISVLRDGEYNGTVNTADTNEDEVTKLMIGRSLEFDHASKPKDFGDNMLELRGLTVDGMFRDVSFSVRKGEIVGMYGLVGAGRSEVAETIFGLRKPSGGEILLDGQVAQLRSSHEAVAQGIALVPEDRKDQGLILGMNCRDNMTLAGLETVSKNGFMRPAAEKTVYDKYQQAMKIKTPGWRQKVGNLSGGNQQKIVIGKWLHTQPKLLILDEPTRGIDVGSKSEIHALIKELARTGYAVLVISSEMPEVLGVSNRIIAMYDGKVTAEFDGDAVSEDALVQAITGQYVTSAGKPDDQPAA